MEVWGGNRKVAQSVELPGLAGRVYSTPVESAACGGDGSRMLLADVKGHGEAASSVAEKLRDLMHKHINIWDQSDFVRELNYAFHQETPGNKYATAVVLGFYRQTGQLIYTNAAHLCPLWYHAAESESDSLKEESPRRKTEVAGVPRD